MIDRQTRPRWAIFLGIFVGIFGLLTLKSGGEVLFLDGAAREAAGDFVPFVVWFNFLDGFVYILVAIGLVLWRPWLFPWSVCVVALTVVVSIAFGVHIVAGGAYEVRTVGAMIFRSLVWFGVALAVRQSR